jgi:hypothetical protein
LGSRAAHDRDIKSCFNTPAVYKRATDISDITYPGSALPEYFND